MQFRTQIPIPKSNNLIDYNSGIVSLGSCFAVNMSEKLTYFKFKNTTNPFGILFHPQALEKFIDYAVNKKNFTDTDIFFYNERWHSYDAHSDLSNTDKEVLLANLNSAVTSTNAQLNQATHVIITLGTAWVYRHTATDTLVANCHKVPQKQFSKELLSVSAIKNSLVSILHLLNEINPGLTVIFTVSPVRHIKDGFVENQRSKAHLITALDDVLNENTSLKTGYFPSYEIMMDELRDYRFYNQDMLHPNATAIDYIWQRFTETYMDATTQSVMNEVDSIQKGLLHRSFNPDSAQYIAFINKLKDKSALLKQQYPHIQF